MAVKKSAMHSQRNRTENAGGQRFAGDWCHYAGARVHGGKHVSGPENQEQHAGNDQRHEDKEIGECSDLHDSEPLAWVVVEDAIKNRQNGFDQPGHGAGDVVHLGLRFLALRCALKPLIELHQLQVVREAWGCMTSVALFKQEAQGRLRHARCFGNPVLRKPSSNQLCAKFFPVHTRILPCQY